LQPLNIDKFAPQLNEIPFTLNFTCNFHSLGQFLAELAQAKRIIAARDITLSSSGSEKYSVNGTCIVYAFSLKK